PRQSGLSCFHRVPPRGNELMRRYAGPGTRLVVRTASAAALIATLGVLGSGLPAGQAQQRQDSAPPTKGPGAARKKDADRAKQPAVKLGLHTNGQKAHKGYTLLATMGSKKTYLIDMEGKVVQTWTSDTDPSLSAYLLENGHLLRAGSVPQQSFGGFL